MKRIVKSVLTLAILLLFFLIAPFSLKAGDGDPGDPGCNPYGYRWDGTQWILCPIDDGVYILLGIGVVYGIVKMRDKRKMVEK